MTAPAAPPADPTRVAFGLLLRALRGEESVTAVADRLGVARQTLLDLENGRSNPTLDRIDRLGSAYGVTFEIVALDHDGYPAPAGGR